MSKVETTKCDRCGRMLTSNTDLFETAEPTQSFEAKYGDEEICYEDVCKRCAKRLAGVFEIAKPKPHDAPRKRKAKGNGRKKKHVETPPQAPPKPKVPK